VNIPAGEGAYPILALGEGTNLQTGLVLATANAMMSALNQQAETVAGALTHAQERRLGAARTLPVNPWIVHSWLP
jgi:hypothetical protein